MSRIVILSLILVLALAFAVSCSGGSDNVIVPPNNERIQVAETPGTTNLLGFWQVVIDTQNGTIEAIDMRSSDLIINVLGFMEPPPLSSMSINFTTLVISDPTIAVDVIFSHPIPDAVFKGFDVRGIVFGAGLNNADGYTDVCNPEFFVGVPFGYQDGLLGVPDSVANYSGIAGYKYFADGIGLNDDITTFFSVEGNLDDRGVFSEAPATHSRHYELDWTDSTQPFFTFNYAVYANYNWPVGDPGDGVSAWDISTANSAEAFACKVTELANSLWFSGGGGGGALSLQVEVWDWQGDITTVSVQSWDGTVIPESFFDVIAGPGTSKSTLYEFYNMAGDPTTTGDLDLLITATDQVTFGDAWFFGLLPPSNSKYGDLLYNCFKYTTTVIECAPPVPTSITPSSMMSYPGIYDDVDIAGDFFTLSGGVTEVYLDDGTTQIDGTDINVTDDENLTCDFDLTADPFDTGDYDVVVVTACEGRGDDLATLTDNLLFWQDFADGDGNCEGIHSLGYKYCSSTGRWEESTCGASYQYAYPCGRFVTPEFDVPSTASDVHFRMNHSGDTEGYCDAVVAGWTPDDGTTFYGDVEDGNNYWKFESGMDYSSVAYLYAAFGNDGCLGCTSYSGWAYRSWQYSFGTYGSGTWSQFHLTGGENLIGMSDARFEVILSGDGSVNRRGHEIYELCIWYDPA